MPDFPISNKCNNNCLICSNPNDFKSLENDKFDLCLLINRLERFRRGENEFFRNYRDSFTITGGEPTISPYFKILVSKMKDNHSHMPIKCLSNGRRFYYQSFTKNILSLSDNLEFIIPLHSHNAKTHDLITQVPGSFKETLEGLINLFKFRKNHLIEIRIIIHKLNYLQLERFIKFIKNKFPSLNRLVFIFIEFEGQAVKNLKSLKLNYSLLRPHIEKLHSLLPAVHEVRFYHFPLCILPSDFYSYIWRTLPKEEVTFLKNCNHCCMKKNCLGIPKTYLKHIGPNEFRPIQKIDINKTGDWHHPIKL